MDDYRDRKYLSAIEAAKYLGTSVKKVHRLVKDGTLRAHKAASTQLRFDLKDLQELERSGCVRASKKPLPCVEGANVLKGNGTIQTIYVKSSHEMSEVPDRSVHMVVTSPPYFNTKMYSKERVENDLGNLHDLDEWFGEISRVWREVYRVLQPGRKAFINIMNLPIRTDNSFRSLNLVGRTVEVCEAIGFIFKRDIVWHKPNSVRAHFGTYPYPGGILLNHAHEFILELERPATKGFKKYTHLTEEQREASKLDKDFWISIKKTDVWTIKPEGSGDRRTHIAPFPYELPARLIRAFSFVGETVLDPFMGSGTVLLAARDLRRNGIGYEINSEIAAGAVAKINSPK
jgi:excisionase family DNA binding protein